MIFMRIHTKEQVIFSALCTAALCWLFEVTQEKNASKLCLILNLRGKKQVVVIYKVLFITQSDMLLAASDVTDF